MYRNELMSCVEDGVKQTEYDADISHYAKGKGKVDHASVWSVDGVIISLAVACAWINP